MASGQVILKALEKVNTKVAGLDGLDGGFAEDPHGRAESCQPWKKINPKWMFKLGGVI